MEQAVIAIGSNLGDRLEMVRKAGEFLGQISMRKPVQSSIWESEPVGGAKYTFYNAAALITTDLHPLALLHKLKDFEMACGRKKEYTRWSPRILDLDIITYGNLVIEMDNLIIPHPEYKKRLFVLYPLEEICPAWVDHSTGESLDVIIKNAPDIEMKKTELEW
ncbi:MAG TPA: 2-amino-4-hydroxy-6-hydroxymethyldihydropteridine diphosphokinase [Balneolaceae bacterium]|nr:2-amino-4-hydroxy-6-hydroxymethyldihydropteridine diphosphokinase [Balneolaceae bacterium]